MIKVIGVENGEIILISARKILYAIEGDGVTTIRLVGDRYINCTNSIEEIERMLNE